MANLTLVSNQLFLDTFVLTVRVKNIYILPSGNKNIGNYVLLVCVDCPVRDAYTVSDAVLVDCLSGTNYILNLFWGIVLNCN